MTQPTKAAELPDALRLADALRKMDEAKKYHPSGPGGQMLGCEQYRLIASGFTFEYLQSAAAELRRLHAENEALRAQSAGAPHVQNPAEIEHVAGDVSKNGAEVNTNVYAELPPRYYLAGGVEKTWDQQQMCVFADATHALRAQQPAPATQQAGDALGYTTGITWTPHQSEQVKKITRYAQPEYGYNVAIYTAPQPSPTPQAGSQPAPEYVGNGMFKGETIEKAAEHWANWCDRRCMNGLAEFLRVVAARAPADSVTAPAGGADWQDISTAPKDGTRFVAVGQNYGLDSEAQHTCIAQWLAGCWVEVSDWNGASKLKYLTHWMPLPPLPGSAASAPADSVLEDAARWQWLADYLVGERTDLDEGIVACATIDALRQFADAARKQGGA